MKKTFKDRICFISICIISLFSFIFLSCEEVEEEVAKKPDIDVVTGGISISFAFDSEALYANIYRQEIVSEGKPAILNIGEVIPKEEAINDSYIFIDNFLKTETKYKYSIRYKHLNSFVYSGWSDWPVDENGGDKTPPSTSFASDDALKFTLPEGTFFEFSDTTKCITLKGTAITALAGFTDFYPSICVAYGDVSRIFSLENYCEKGSGLPLDTKIDLRTLLTQDFFDVELEIKGILYQKTDATKSSYDKISWSQITKVPVKDESAEELSTITISFNNSEDDLHDFTNYDGTRSIVMDY